MNLSLIEALVYLGIAIIIILVFVYLFIIRSFKKFINEQRYLNEMYQLRHIESLKATSEDKTKEDS